MGLNRRDLLKALSGAPLVGLLGIAPEEEKILARVDPEFVEIIEEQKTRIAYQSEWFDVTLISCNYSYKHERPGLVEMEMVRVVPVEQMMIMMTDNLAASYDIMNAHLGRTIQAKFRGREWK